MISETPQALTGEIMASRIYSPFAYPLPRRTPIVPVVSIEAERLAGAFPIVWRKGVHGPELVALRTLLEDGTGFVPGTGDVLALLPLLFQAYPIVLPADRVLSAQGNPRLIDVAGADRPSDAGAPIAGADGRLSKGTELRLRALDLFERDFQRTLAVSRAIEERGLLEPWPLVFDLGHGRSCDITELLVVAPAAFDTPRIAPVLSGFGAMGARLLSAHRLSLFRTGLLLNAARMAIAAIAAEVRP